jgi:site-specific recombinase XerD
MSTALIQLGCTQDATTTCDSPPDLARYLANLAPATYRAYAGHVGRYQATGRPLDRQNVVEWIASLARAGLSRKTVQQALAAVKLAVREAHYAGQVDAVTADAVRTIDVGWAGTQRGERVGKWLEVAQVRQLFESIDERTATAL